MMSPMPDISAGKVQLSKTQLCKSAYMLYSRRQTGGFLCLHQPVFKHRGILFLNKANKTEERRIARMCNYGLLKVLNYGANTRVETEREPATPFTG